MDRFGGVSPEPTFTRREEMIFKYVRHEEIGFIIWPCSGDLQHKHIGQLAIKMAGGAIVSAGFVDFDRGGPRCHGHSESLGISSKPEDSAELAKQLELTPRP